jgi:hypothetical protein
VDRALGEADRIDRRLETLRSSLPTPEWKVATMARAGSLYDCLRNSLLRATPTLFTPDQQAKLNRLLALTVQLSVTGPPQQSGVQQTINGTVQLAAKKWQSTCYQYLSILGQKTVLRYATAALLARRYALEGFDLARARRRLPVVARELGKEEMARILRDLVDPTAPAWDASRHVEYVEGAFD